MRKLFAVVLLLCLFAPSSTFAQQRKFKKSKKSFFPKTELNEPVRDPAAAVLLPNPLAGRIENEPPRDFEDYLVQLAIANNPDIEAVGHKLEIDRQEISLAKKEWNKNLTAGINVNESNLPYFLVNTLNITKINGREIDLGRIPQTVNYPFWNLGLNLNVGDILNRKHKIKIAETKQKITLTEGKRRKTEVRMEVLTRYQKYLSTFEILKVRLQLVDAAEANKISVANLYAVNKAKIDEYNEANKAYFEALEEKVKAESEIKLAKYELEGVLGERWETVEKMKLAYENAEKEQKKETSKQDEEKKE
ncbi:MAG: hypothetical protein RL757_683 [Bacteroidota bacterium]|jgi:outer membrane protein TolC